MCRHTVFSVVVHGLRADLNLGRLSAGITHHGMQRLVTIAFGLGNVVVKFFGNRAVMAVHPAQRTITLRHTGHHNAHGAHVKNPLKTERLATHLFHNAVDVFGATRDSRADAMGVQILFKLNPHALDMGLALYPLFI